MEKGFWKERGDSMKDSFAYPVIVMAVITGILVFILAFLNASTAERVELLQETHLRTSILYVFEVDVDTDDPEEIEDIFNENVEEEEVDGQRVFTYVDNGEELAYAFPFDGSGLWGSIEGYAGITTDLAHLVGVVFVDHEETPGLGGRIDELEFREQFRDIDLTDETGGDYIVTRPSSGGNIDAIAGATQTSNSVVNMLNEDIEWFREVKGGE